MKMKNAQKPEVGMGTETPKGVVVQISHDHVVVETRVGGPVALGALPPDVVAGGGGEVL